MKGVPNQVELPNGDTLLYPMQFRFTNDYYLGMDQYEMRAVVSGTRIAIKPFEAVELKDRDAVPVCGVFSREDLQSMANALWDAGIKPKQGHGSHGEIQAVRGHLDDMRKIAFHKLGIDATTERTTHT